MDGSALSPVRKPAHPGRKQLPQALDLSRQNEAESRVLAQSFPSPSDRMLSPMSKALLGGKRKNVFGLNAKPRSQPLAAGGHSHLAPSGLRHEAGAAAPAVAPSAAAPSRFAAASSGAASVMQKKAMRQAFMSGGKTSSTQSRTSSDEEAGAGAGQGGSSLASALDEAATGSSAEASAASEAVPASERPSSPASEQEQTAPSGTSIGSAGMAAKLKVTTTADHGLGGDTAGAQPLRRSPRANTGAS